MSVPARRDTKRVVILFEEESGRQHAWEVTNLTHLSWTGPADSASVRVDGVFHRMAKDPERHPMEGLTNEPTMRGEFGG